MNGDPRAVFEALARPNARVIFYGTSLTRSGGWVELLAAELRRRRPALEIFNRAQDGRHSRWGVENFSADVCAHAPDVLFLEFAVNDAVARFELSPEESRRNLEVMLDQLAARQPTCAVVLQVMNPVIDRPLGHDGHRPQLVVYEQVARDVAIRRGHLLVDHAPAWQTLLAQGDEAFRAFVPDGLHPTAAAYERFMLPTLQRAIGLP